MIYRVTDIIIGKPKVRRNGEKLEKEWDPKKTLNITTECSCLPLRFSSRLMNTPKKKMEIQINRSVVKRITLKIYGNKTGKFVDDYTTSSEMPSHATGSITDSFAVL